MSSGWVLRFSLKCWSVDRCFLKLQLRQLSLIFLYVSLSRFIFKWAFCISSKASFHVFSISNYDFCTSKNAFHCVSCYVLVLCHVMPSASNLHFLLWKSITFAPSALAQAKVSATLVSKLLWFSSCMGNGKCITCGCLSFCGFSFCTGNGKCINFGCSSFRGFSFKTGNDEWNTFRWGFRETKNLGPYFIEKKTVKCCLCGGSWLGKYCCIATCRWLH